MSSERKGAPRPSWVIAYRYPDMDSAGVAYSGARDIVFDNAIDASVYRLQLNGVPHVVLVGEHELNQHLQDEIAAVWGSGQPTDIPREVIEVLFDRRRDFKLPGAFWERRSV